MASFHAQLAKHRVQLTRLLTEILDDPYLAASLYFKGGTCAAMLGFLDRCAICQTRATLFANKLVAPLDRFERNGAVTGRDIYDIHHFFLQGYAFDPAVIEERRGATVSAYLQTLLAFVEKQVTQTVINQDLNVLLEPEKFQQIRKTLKTEVMMFIRDAM